MDLHDRMKQLELGTKQQHMQNAVDRITNLPDSLLHHILSFLEIKDVARTSVLSKRWREIWKSVPTLDFLSLYGGTEDLVHIVDRVLLFRDKSSIQKLSLSCWCDRWDREFFLRATHVNLWIEYAVMHKVKELSLTLKHISGFETFCPSPLFTCKSLTSLELTISAPYNKFSIPKHMSIPNLKHLKLGKVNFSNEYELSGLSNCPVLEDLTLISCDWVDVRSFSISVPSPALEVLTLISCECVNVRNFRISAPSLVLGDLTLENCKWGDLRNFCISAPSVERLKIINDSDLWQRRYTSPGLRDSCLNIHAPRLVSFAYKNSFPKDFVMSSSPTLAEADVADLFFRADDPAVTEKRTDVGSAAIRFLRLLSDVKVLSIDKELLMALSFADDLSAVLPTFNNLKQLSVSVEAIRSEALVSLLQSAPIMESLVIKELAFYTICCEEDRVEGNDCSEPQIMTTGCCFSHLKSVYFVEFKGHTWEMWWVKLFLEKAKALQTITITYSSPHWENAKSKEDVMADLSSLVRASAMSCVLNFS